MRVIVPELASPHISLEEQLSRLATRRIFFGHQSVGQNLLDGVSEIALRHPAIRLRVAPVSSGLDAGVIGHALMPENGVPELKLLNFERALDSGIGAVADVALLKLCYLDFSAGTDPIRLFARYRTTMTALGVKYSRVAFVHVTVPLTAMWGGTGTVASVKRILGREPGSLVANSRREEFNELLRRRYGEAKELFDLALLESTAPSGARELHFWNGRAVPTLCPAYTDDGGHLNAAARVSMAQELVGVLASRGRPE